MAFSLFFFLPWMCYLTKYSCACNLAWLNVWLTLLFAKTVAKPSMNHHRKSWMRALNSRGQTRVTSTQSNWIYFSSSTSSVLMLWTDLVRCDWYFTLQVCCVTPDKDGEICNNDIAFDRKRKALNHKIDYRWLNIFGSVCILYCFALKMEGKFFSFERIRDKTTLLFFFLWKWNRGFIL